MDVGYNIITSTRQGPLVNVLVWVFMVIMIMASITKIANTWFRKRTLALDDYLLVAASAIAIGQTVAISEAVAHGLGNQDAAIDVSERTKYEQALYAADFLYLATLHLTKTVTACFTSSFAPLPWVKTVTTTQIYGHLAWTTISIFATAFRCNLPTPWEYVDDKCINIGAFWDVYATFDILSDIALISVPIAIVQRIQATRPQRWSIIIAFAFRLLTVPLIVLRVFFLNQSYRSGELRYSDEVKATVLTGVHVHVAVILTCVPFIKSVMEGLQGGAMSSDLAGVRRGNKHSSYQLSNISNSRHKAVAPAVIIPRKGSSGRPHANTPRSMISTADVRSAVAPSPSPRSSSRLVNPGPSDILVQTTITMSTEPV